MKTKILLVEDEQQLRETLTELLSINNYQVMSAEDGVKASQILQFWTPNVIVSDIMMPNCNGYEFYNIVRENPKFNYIPFIFLSAKKAEEELNHANMLGIDAFISKPFKANELIAIIEARLARYVDIKNNYDLLGVKFDDYMIHEIYSPLKRIIGVTSYLNLEENIVEDNTNYIESINNNAQKLDRTLNNIITYQKISNGTYLFQDDAVTNVQNCFLEIYNKISIEQQKKISFHFKKNQVAISRNDLLFVLHEIIDNAIKFALKNQQIIIKCTANVKFYTIKIKDFGLGMNKGEIDKIGPFVQFFNKIEQKEGLGLGLYLSKIIIENYKGKFNIRSTKGIGTEIEIVIPSSE